MKLDVGRVVYSYNINERSYLVCKWYMYPFMRFKVKFTIKKFWFYFWLNKLGIMKSSVGEIMQLKDIFRRSRK